MRTMRMDRVHSLRNTAAAALAALSLVAIAPAHAGGLTDLLMSQVGVTQPQAEGGAGSIFKLAKAQMTSANFAKLKGAVPGMNNYLDAAPAVAAASPAASALSPTPSTTPSTTGALASAAAQALGNSQLGGLGGVGGKLATIQQLAPAFEQLGMKQKVITKFVPVVVDYVKQQGGMSTAKLLTGALGF